MFSEFGPRLLPYFLAAFVGLTVTFLSGIIILGVAAGIFTWLWWCGYLPGPIAHWEKRERKKRGIPELKFKVGDRVCMHTSTGIENGTITGVSPKREIFSVTLDFGGNPRWHTVFDQEVFDVATVSNSASPSPLRSRTAGGPTAVRSPHQQARPRANCR